MRLRLRFHTLIQAARWLFLFVAALFFLPAGSAQAANYFTWGAEGISGANVPRCAGNTVDCWSSHLLNSATTITTAVKHSGSASMRIVPTMVSTDEPLGLDVPDMTGKPPTYASNVLGSQIYYRWWMRIDPGFDWGDGATWGGPAVARTKSGRQNEPGTDPASQWYTGTVRASGFYLAECMASSGHSGACLNNNGTTGSDQGPMGVSYDMTAHDDGQWHEYIVRIKYNTSASCTTPGTCDAEIEVYVDGTSVGSYTGFRLTNRDGQAYEHWGSWMTNPYFQGGSSYSAGGTIYLDDFSTDDTWNSTAGGSDTTAPTAPTSLSCPSSVTTSITCTWTASTDAVGVTGYKVERRSLPDGGAWTQAGLPSGTSYADTVPETTRYEYRVSAADAAGNWSATSTTTTATSHINVAFDYGVNLPLEFRNGTWNSTQRGLALDAVVAMCGSDCWVRMDITHSSVCPTTTGTPIYGTCDWSAYNTLSLIHISEPTRPY